MSVWRLSRPLANANSPWIRGTPEQAAAMMKPYAGDIEAWEVGPEVGNVRNNRLELIERLGLL